MNYGVFLFFILRVSKIYSNYINLKYKHCLKKVLFIKTKMLCIGSTGVESILIFIIVGFNLMQLYFFNRFMV
jgi:hypothetical protein